MPLFAHLSSFSACYLMKEKGPKTVSVLSLVYTLMSTLHVREVSRMASVKTSNGFYT